MEEGDLGQIAIPEGIEESERESLRFDLNLERKEPSLGLGRRLFDLKKGESFVNKRGVCRECH